MLDLFRNNSIIFMLFFAAFLCFFWLMHCRKKLRMNWIAAIILALLEVVFALLFAKVFARLEGSGNMSLYGGLFFLPAVYIVGALTTKRDVRDVVDVFSVCTLITVLFARLNCFIAGCCLGNYIQGTQSRWPTREFEVVLYLVLLYVFVYRIRKNKAHGELYPIYMIVYSVSRFITEFLRESDQLNLFHRAHYWSIICFVIGICALLFVNKTQKNKTKRIRNRRRGENDGK